MDEESGTVIEDDQMENIEEVSNKKVRHRKKQLYQTIRKQMEFYFSDANLTKDRFLGKLLMEDPYIDLSIFIRFNRIRALTTNVQDIAKALRNSELLSVTEDGTKVFRTTPVKVKNNIDDCTIYVEQLPPDAQHDFLKDVFSAYGKVAYVSIPKYKNSGKIKGFAFVEFETPEEANKTLEAFTERGCRLSSQIAPEKLCSIATFENEEEKTENKPEETDKEIPEKTNEEEDSQLQDKLSRKKRKRKKGKQENSEEVTLESSEPEEEKEVDTSIKKHKKKRSQDSRTEENEAEMVESDDDSPPRKKKRKESEETEVEVEKQKEKIENANSDQQPSDVETCSGKRKRKRQSEDDEEAEEKLNNNKLDASDSKGQDVVEEQLEKKKQKRKSEEIEREEKNISEIDTAETMQDNIEAYSQKKRKRRSGEEKADASEYQQIESEGEQLDKDMEEKQKKAASGNEENGETGAEEEIIAEGTEMIKKKTRKRRKKHKKDKQDVEANRLQILSKREWKRLRNKYLDLQKAKMRCLKQYLNKSRWNSSVGYYNQARHNDRFQHTNGQSQEKEDHSEGNAEAEGFSNQVDSKPRITYTPAVIVHAVLDEPIMDVRKFKIDAKALPDVEYVDVIMGANEAFIRCSSAAAAENLVSNAPWQQTEVLEGEEESNYWKKIFDDRKQKFSNNVRVKQRGRDKILRRAERELGKHIRFDD